MKLRISQKGKFSKFFPKPVADRIREIASEYSNLKSITYQDKSSSDIFHVGEGERYEGITTDGFSEGFEVVSASMIGASGLSYAINSKFQMPEGTYLVRVSYYTKYFMDVYFIGPAAIAG